VTQFAASKIVVFRGASEPGIQCGFRASQTAHPGMTNGETEKRPAVISDGRPVSACRKFCAVCDATLTEFFVRGEGVENALRDDFGSDVADAGTGQTDRAGRARGQVEYAAANKWPAVVDGDDDAAAAMGHLELGAERQ
jgi:hypothetical protein